LAASASLLIAVGLVVRFVDYRKQQTTQVGQVGQVEPVRQIKQTEQIKQFEGA
jgi:hypothetical protein